MPTTIEDLPNELLLKIFKYDTKNHGWSAGFATAVLGQKSDFLRYLYSRMVNKRLLGVALDAWWQVFTASFFHVHNTFGDCSTSTSLPPRNTGMMRRASGVTVLVILRSPDLLDRVCPHVKTFLIQELPLCAARCPVRISGNDKPM